MRLHRIAAALLSGCAFVADAGSLADVTVINRTTGERLPIYRYHGRMYVEGRAGERYARLPRPFHNGGFVPDPSWSGDAQLQRAFGPGLVSAGRALRVSSFT